MDKATFVGFLGSCGLVYYCMYAGANGQMMAYWSASALVLVFCGSLTCTLMSIPWATAMDSWRVVKKCIICKEQSLDKVVNQMTDLAGIARQDGLLALESEIVSLEDEFLAEGLKMVIDGKKPDEIEVNMRLQLHGMVNRHKRGKKLFSIMGVYAPAYGLLTTIIGQVVMFKNMGTDISAIGSGMAVALLGTLYGSLLSNLVCLPFADKLELRNQEEELEKEIYLQGILAIADESSPMVLKQRLLSFLDKKTLARVQMAS
jgi:chemotaxis protein MotA